jgi:hypothetical protein
MRHGKQSGNQLSACRSYMILLHEVGIYGDIIEGPFDLQLSSFDECE